MQNSELDKRVQKLNEGSKIKIRIRKITDGFSLYLDFFFNNKRQRYSPGIVLLSNGLKNKKDRDGLKYIAALRDKKELDFLQDRNKLVVFANKKSHVLWTEYVNSFRDNNKSKDFNKRTGSYIFAFKNFEKEQGRKYLLDQMNEDVFEVFKQFLLRNYAYTTGSGYLSMTKKYVKEAYRSKLIAEDTGMDIVNIPRKNQKRIHLTLDEIDLLIKEPCRFPFIKEGFLFSCATGLRYSDLVRVTRDNIHDGNYITITQKKFKVPNMIPLNAYAKKILDSINYLDVEGSLFRITGRGRINYKLRMWSLKAGVRKEFTFHSARHTFATLGLENGIDLYTMSKYLGHANVSVTERVYSHIATKRITDQMKKFPKFEK